MVVMAHGVNAVLKRAPGAMGASKTEPKTGIGSRRIFPPHFKLQVLDSYRNDADCKGNQRATARKYGIHRRQIQKWLQAEGNLRNSVKGGVKVECGEGGKCGIELALRSAGHRQRDDAASDAYSRCPSQDDRVPALSPAAYSDTQWPEASNSPQHHQHHPQHENPPQRLPVPLDFTTHSRAPLGDLIAPIDLSLKRPAPVAPGDPPCAPVRRYSPPHQQHQHQKSTSPPLIHPPTPLCLVRPTPTSPLRTSPEPDPAVWDLSTKNTLKRKHQEEQPMHSPASSTVSSTKPVKLFKPYLDDLHDSSSSSEDLLQPKIEDNGSPQYPDTLHAYYNNNNLYEVKSEYTYTLHELQPNNPLYYYPTITKGYLYSPERDSTYLYDDTTVNLLHPSSAPLKQRQSYSLDFKLRTIECYYRDEMCRGNQRAVASKYNIHRRQVQKWLKQEEELRQRNESVTKIHAVR